MSQKTNNNQSSALEIAWHRYAEFDNNAQKTSRQHLRLRDGVIVLGVVATLLAILTDVYSGPNQLLDRGLRIGLILAPIVGSAVLAFANKFQQGESWLALRTGAEEILKEIYLYRTLLQQEEERDQWLNKRVTAIQRQVFEVVGDDLVLEPYTGKIPPYYYPAHKNSDPGFSDLLADEYLGYRLANHLE